MSFAKKDLRRPELPSERLKMMEQSIMDAMSFIPGLDWTQNDLRNSPRRIAKMWVAMCAGLVEPLDEDSLRQFTLASDCGLVGSGRISFSSICAHHFLPFFGHVHVFYIPSGKVLGISKFSRIVNHLAAKPQIQEQLQAEIADTVMSVTKALGCFCIIHATHTCMKCRGVKQDSAVMVTSAIRPLNEDGLPAGPFAKVEARTEALMLMNGHHD